MTPLNYQIETTVQLFERSAVPKYNRKRFV